MSENHRCNYPPGVKSHSQCGVEGAQPKFTKKLNQTLPGERQPVWRCQKHWREEQEISATSGVIIRRRFGDEVLPYIP